MGRHRSATRRSALARHEYAFDRITISAAGAIDGSQHIPLAELPGRLSEVPAGPVVVYCAGGTRSSIAASLLRRSGHRDVSDLIGGEAAWRLALTPAPGN